MISFNPITPFAFNYPTTDMQSSLNLRASIYDVSTGSPVFLTTVNLSEISNGFYSGNYQPSSGKTYLVIVLNYTDNTYSTIDTTRAPWAECFKSTDAPAGFMAFNYGAFDQESTLDVASNLYDVTTGSPVFSSQVGMAHVLGGVYFGSFSGIANHSYDNLKFVYQDSGFTVVDSNWSPGSDIISLFSVAPQLILVNSAILKGQAQSAVLNGQALSAVLKGTA